jgi:putative glutamine amidotransferase
MRPVIALSCGESHPLPYVGPDGRATYPQAAPLPRMGVPVSYLRSVEAAGGAPVLLPNTPVADVVRAALTRASGLLLTGGGDMRAEAFGQDQHPQTTFVDTLRDETETLAIHEALRLGLPILGICRGIQVLAVAMGGSLIQHLPDHLGGDDRHPRNVDHPVRTEGGSLLSGLWPEEIVVNSKHHQAVDSPGESLKITARAPDGIVEAVESVDGAAVLGLQCHPELLSATRKEFAAPFEWLVAQARARG